MWGPPGKPADAGSPGGPLTGGPGVVAGVVAGVAVAVGEGEVAVGAPVGGPMALLPLQALLLPTPPGQPLQPVSD